jgi:hypothetical protein
MDAFSTENLVTTGCVILAVAGWIGVNEFTSLPDLVSWAVLIGVGVVVPTATVGALRRRESGQSS